HQLSRYRKLARKLRDYPLYPYLEHQELVRRLARARPAEVDAFPKKNPDTPLATRLRHKWLEVLARQGEWQRLARQEVPLRSSRGLQCSYSRALLETGQADKAYQRLQRLWLTGRSLPRSCDVPLQAWRASGKLTDDLVWQRIRLAMQRGNVRLARHLARDLPKAEQFWVNIWAKVRRDPAYVLEVNDHFVDKSHASLDWITVYGLRRLARKDPKLAAESWQKLRKTREFSVSDQERIERRLALALLQEREPAVREWLGTLNHNHFDDRVISLHFFSALQDQDWDTALGWLERLEPDQQHTARWRYWRGRVLEGMGHLEEAREVYLLNGENRGYYSFLAADRAGYRYSFTSRPLMYQATDLASLQALPPIRRARELYALNRQADARREWNHAMERLSRPQLLKAAKLADEWGWHDRAIATLARARYWDDLELRFPLAHQKQVLSQAKRQKVNPAWAFAIIRQESAFTADARSHAGAMGLMQLMPRTARRVARSMKLRPPRYYDLLKIDTNIRLGVRYLKKVRDRNQGHPVLATAAYNAGQTRVSKWLPKQGQVAADIWIETVPFRETRDYLKRVMTYTVIYEQRLGRDPVPLLERMSPIIN
ncbi:MAG TPA: murein transglycosylase, partial [Chromatiales bacterium]|nr:murein transglycosylase [Chromatiales bacterium]